MSCESGLRWPLRTSKVAICLWGTGMHQAARLTFSSAVALVLLVLGLFGCATGPSPETPAAPAIGPALPPAFPPRDIVGRWGLAAYHKDEDRARTEAAPARGCNQPYVISLGPSGGVMMHLADQATPPDLALKGAEGASAFIG